MKILNGNVFCEESSQMLKSFFVIFKIILLVIIRAPIHPTSSHISPKWLHKVTSIHIKLRRADWRPALHVAHST